jgi:hypothetical protein
LLAFQAIKNRPEAAGSCDRFLSNYCCVKVTFLDAYGKSMWRKRGGCPDTLFFKVYTFALALISWIGMYLWYFSAWLFGEERTDRFLEKHIPTFWLRLKKAFRLATALPVTLIVVPFLGFQKLASFLFSRANKKSGILALSYKAIGAIFAALSIPGLIIIGIVCLFDKQNSY